MTLARLIPAVAAILALASCAAVSLSSPAACVIDPALVMPWSDYHRADEPRPPNVFVYEGCGKTLVYVGAQHTNDPESEAYRAIREAVKRWPPGMLVAEGFPEAMGPSPSVLLKYANNLEGDPADSEGFEAIRRVTAAGGAFVGGEPDETTILAGMEAQGFTASDLFAFYVIRQINQWQRERKIADHRDPGLDALITQLAGMTARDFGVPVERLSDVATRDGVAAWYERINHRPFDTGYRPEDSYPSGPANNRPTNAFSDRASDFRDQHIVQVIARSLEAHDTVLVVYGNSHHTIQAPALAAAFGPPVLHGKLDATP